METSEEKEQFLNTITLEKPPKNEILYSDAEDDQNEEEAKIEYVRRTPSR